VEHTAAPLIERRVARIAGQGGPATAVLARSPLPAPSAARSSGRGRSLNTMARLQAQVPNVGTVTGYVICWSPLTIATAGNEYRISSESICGVAVA
jgi:hypothetical protein